MSASISDLSSDYSSVTPQVFTGNPAPSYVPAAVASVPPLSAQAPLPPALGVGPPPLASTVPPPGAPGSGFYARAVPPTALPPTAQVQGTAYPTSPPAAPQAMPQLQPVYPPPGMMQAVPSGVAPMPVPPAVASFPTPGPVMVQTFQAGQPQVFPAVPAAGTFLAPPASLGSPINVPLVAAPASSPQAGRTAPLPPERLRSSRASSVASGYSTPLGSASPSYVPSPTLSNRPIVLERIRVEEDMSTTVSKNGRWVAPLAAELVGSFLLVFGAGPIMATAGTVWAPTGMACLVTALVYVLAPLSGAILNPAVAFAAAATKKISWLQCLGYIVADLAGGKLGGLAQAAVLNGQGAAITVSPVGSFTWLQAYLVEGLFTAILCLAYLSVMASRRNNPEHDQNHFYGHAVGFVYIAGGYAATSVTGGAFFNPALSVGLGDWSAPGLWPFVYAAFELTGAVLAVIVYHICRSEDFQEVSGPPSPDGLAKSPRHRLCAEFFGTFFLTFAIGASVILRSEATPWSAAAAVLCLMYSLGDVSGAVFNPATSLALALCRRSVYSAWDSLGYVVVQFIGGLLSGLLLANVGLAYQPPAASGAAADLPKFGLPSPFQWAGFVTIEILGTAFVVYAFLAVATLPRSHTRQNLHPALAVGGATAAAGFLGVIMLNPATATSMTLAALVGGGSVSLPFAWMLFEFVGGLVASILFSFTHALDAPKPQAAVLVPTASTAVAQ